MKTDKSMQKISNKIGLPAGSMIHIGEQKVEEVLLSVINYDEENFEIKAIEEIKDVIPYKYSTAVTWLDVTGLHKPRVLEDIEKYFRIHPLVLEDILNTSKRPKIEFYEDYFFILLKMISFNEEKKEIDIEQISLILGKNFVITFQEREGDIFNPVRERIKNSIMRIRKRGPDYLLYALVDIIIDHYFLLLDKFEETIEDIEEHVINSPDNQIVQHIHDIKRNYILLHKSIWPLKDVINILIREESGFIKEATLPFLRDLQDHIIQIIEIIESHRDMLSGLMDLFLTNTSAKMNKVMKVLTIIATIFIPLTFLAGIYGMNFEFMPELRWQWGYPVIWIIMISIGTTLLIFFKKRKWL